MDHVIIVINVDEQHGLCVVSLSVAKTSTFTYRVLYVRTCLCSRVSQCLADVEREMQTVGINWEYCNKKRVSLAVEDANIYNLPNRNTCVKV